MKTYFALVEGGDETHAHSVRFPDLPGCFSAADEVDDIIAMAIEAMQLWAEGEPMPEPSTHEELIRREDIREELATGNCYLLAIPFIDNDGEVLRVNISVERGLLKAIDATADARGLTRSSFLAQTARREIERAPRASSLGK